MTKLEVSGRVKNNFLYRRRSNSIKICVFFEEIKSRLKKYLKIFSEILFKNLKLEFYSEIGKVNLLNFIS